MTSGVVLACEASDRSIGLTGADAEVPFIFVFVVEEPKTGPRAGASSSLLMSTVSCLFIIPSSSSELGI
jgi:hypothetical protein